MNESLNFNFEKVELRMGAGVHITQAIKQAICLSALEACEVTFDFSGVPMSVDVRELIEEKYQEHHSKLSEKGDKK